jgi:hypothetical protein
LLRRRTLESAIADDSCGTGTGTDTSNGKQSGDGYGVDEKGKKERKGAEETLIDRNSCATKAVLGSASRTVEVRERETEAVADTPFLQDLPTSEPACISA